MIHNILINPHRSDVASLEAMEKALQREEPSFRLCRYDKCPGQILPHPSGLFVASVDVRDVWRIVGVIRKHSNVKGALVKW